MPKNKLTASDRQILQSNMTKDDRHILSKINRKDLTNLLRILLFKHTTARPKISRSGKNTLFENDVQDNNDVEDNVLSRRRKIVDENVLKHLKNRRTSEEIFDSFQPQEMRKRNEKLNVHEPQEMNSRSELEELIETHETQEMNRRSEPEELIDTHEDQEINRRSEPEELIDTHEAEVMNRRSDPEVLINSDEAQEMNIGPEPEEPIKMHEPQEMNNMLEEQDLDKSLQRGKRRRFPTTARTKGNFGSSVKHGSGEEKLDETITHGEHKLNQHRNADIFRKHISNRLIPRGINTNPSSSSEPITTFSFIRHYLLYGLAPIAVIVILVLIGVFCSYVFKRTKLNHDNTMSIKRPHIKYQRLGRKIRTPNSSLNSEDSLSSFYMSLSDLLPRCIEIEEKSQQFPLVKRAKNDNLDRSYSDSNLNYGSYDNIHVLKKIEDSAYSTINQSGSLHPTENVNDTVVKPIMVKEGSLISLYQDARTLKKFTPKNEFRRQYYSRVRNDSGDSDFETASESENAVEFERIFSRRRKNRFKDHGLLT